MTEANIAALARRYFNAFQNADRAGMEALLAPEFTFTSPFDAAISRAAYFERCWPFAGSFRFRADMQIFESGSECVVVYATEGKPGGTFRNAELLRFEGGRLVSIDVFFGFLPKEILKADN